MEEQAVRLKPKKGMLASRVSAAKYTPAWRSSLLGYTRSTILSISMANDTLPVRSKPLLAIPR